MPRKRASASGALPDGRTLGLNLGRGFGDLSRATENCVILDGRVHKLDQVSFDYQSGETMRPWRFTDNEGRLDLTFTPFHERVARTALVVIDSEVHQMFGRYSGTVQLDDGQQVEVRDLIWSDTPYWVERGYPEYARRVTARHGAF